MGLGILILGLLVFLGTHVFVSFREARAACDRPTRPTGLSGIVRAGLAGRPRPDRWGYAHYRAHGWIDVWSPPAFMRHITVGLMLFSVIFMVAAFVPSHIKAGSSIRCWPA